MPKLRRYVFIAIAAYLGMETLGMMGGLGAMGSTDSRKCPDTLPELADKLTQDLPNYLNRTYSRLGIKQQVTVAGFPDLNPLPIATVNKISIGSLPPPRQIFVSILSRKIGETKTQTQSYWLFISEIKSKNQNQKNWRLAIAFTRIGNSPPQDVSDGAIATATNTWLRDRCNSQIVN